MNSECCHSTRMVKRHLSGAPSLASSFYVATFPGRPGMMKSFWLHVSYWCEQDTYLRPVLSDKMGIKFIPIACICDEDQIRRCIWHCHKLWRGRCRSLWGCLQYGLSLGDLLSAPWGLSYWPLAEVLAQVLWIIPPPVKLHALGRVQGAPALGIYKTGFFLSYLTFQRKAVCVIWVALLHKPLQVSSTLFLYHP